jgi:hypothetical protein
VCGYSEKVVGCTHLFNGGESPAVIVFVLAGHPAHVRRRGRWAVRHLTGLLVAFPSRGRRGNSAIIVICGGFRMWGSWVAGFALTVYLVVVGRGRGGGLAPAMGTCPGVHPVIGGQCGGEHGKDVAGFATWR